MISESTSFRILFGVHVANSDGRKSIHKTMDVPYLLK